MEYINRDLWGNVDRYDIIEKVQPNYIIWNIGDNMNNDTLIPFTTRLSNNKNDDNYYCINRNDLKAIKLQPNEVKLLQKAAHYGVENLSACRKILASKRQCKSYLTRTRLELAKQSLEILERITL